jgi:hypothetical protein
VAELPILLAVMGALALLARLGWKAGREQAALRSEVEGLRDRLDRLHVRLEASEQDLAMALSQTGVAEGLLLEKGIADADEVEDMRRRLVTDADAPGRGDAIH